MALGKSRKELLSSLNSRELTEWRAFEILEPFGEYQVYYAAGIVASVIANVYKKKETKTFVPSDFIPKRVLGDTAPKKQSLEEQMKMAQILEKAFSKRKEK